MKFLEDLGAQNFPTIWGAKSLSNIWGAKVFGPHTFGVLKFSGRIKYLGKFDHLNVQLIFLHPKFLVCRFVFGKFGVCKFNFGVHFFVVESVWMENFNFLVFCVKKLFWAAL